MSELPVDPYYVPPPSGDELPTEDGVPMETQRHRLQMELLITSLDRHLGEGGDAYVGGNMFIYYSALQAKRNDFRGPDVFVVLGGGRRMRKSWVVWEEDGRTPDVVVELTSPSTADEDHGRKMRVYASVLRVPEYVIFDPADATTEVYGLDWATATYRAVEPLASGRYPSPKLGLELGLSPAPFRGYPGPWLRWFEPGGEVLPTEEEVADRESRLRAEESRRRKDAEDRAAALERELEALKRRIADAPPRSGSGGQGSGQGGEVLG